RGKIALQDGDTAAAATSLDRAIRAGDPAVADDAKLERARALLASGELRASYDAVSELRGRPGRIGVDARPVGEQLEERRAAALGPDPIGLALRTAKARLKEGRQDAARDALAPVLASERPERGEALLLVGRIRAAQGATDEARRLFHEAAAGNASPQVAGTAL